MSRTEKVKNKYGYNSVREIPKFIYMVSFDQAVMAMGTFATLYKEGSELRRQSHLQIKSLVDQRYLHLGVTDVSYLILSLHEVVASKEAILEGFHKQYPLTGFCIRVTPYGVWVRHQRSDNVKIISGFHHSSVVTDMEERRKAAVDYVCEQINSLIAALEEYWRAAHAWCRDNTLVPVTERDYNITTPDKLFRGVLTKEVTGNAYMVTAMVNKTMRGPQVLMSCGETALVITDHVDSHYCHSPKDVLEGIANALTELAEDTSNPRTVPLFKGTEHEGSFNGYVSLVPSKSGLRVVINYDINPTYGKVSWYDHNIDIQLLIENLRDIVANFPE